MYRKLIYYTATQFTRRGQTSFLYQYTLYVIQLLTRYIHTKMPIEEHNSLYHYQNTAKWQILSQYKLSQP